ncbi:MAG: hypothetical protein AAGC55_19320 [Myxococcota bacterium]
MPRTMRLSPRTAARAAAPVAAALATPPVARSTATGRPRPIRTLAAALAAAALVGCPGPGPDSDTGPGIGAADPAAAAGLVIPPGDPARVSAALGDLDARARAGDTRAAWLRLHYLIDLFDDARFAASEPSLTALHAALALPGPAARGRAATDRVVRVLGDELARLRGADPNHRHGAAAGAILAFDLRPPRRRAEVPAHMDALRRVADSASPLADNARLRLAAYCQVALRDAARAAGEPRAERLAHCLYPLGRPGTDRDPAAYFSARPGQRPAPPALQWIAERLSAVLDRVAGSTSRVARAGRHQRAALPGLLARFPAEGS